MVDVTGNWVYIGGELVSYDAEPVKRRMRAMYIHEKS